MAIERRLTEIAGPVGGKVHTGRSRNDQVALDLHLYLRDAVAGHRSRLRAHGGPAGPGRGRYATLIFPGYTHLQRAQPVLLAHHLLAYFFMLERDEAVLHVGRRRRGCRWARVPWPG